MKPWAIHYSESDKLSVSPGLAVIFVADFEKQLGLICDATEPPNWKSSNKVSVKLYL